ncbi:hypothetical protein [Myxococcus landrumensis]|uniref:Lipoprotein n=1 Tax=Myxococcus landrumensis TaxID=2813577 RepID=A0ABX7NEI1_9BACT|nr:hypothetical protein [Myxococcus landrumus]QSQ17202.1 hypothetical protein JY572_14570 [Myxococcus landrumus]
MMKRSTAKRSTRATTPPDARPGVVPDCFNIAVSRLADGRCMAQAGGAEPATADLLSTAIAEALTNLARVSPPRDAQAPDLGWPKGKHHWGPPNPSSVQACTKEGCTVRMSHGAEYWQQVRDGHWFDSRSLAVPYCTGKVPPAAVTGGGR